jgi:predicted membrane chloride channel (bestrophin family)
MASPVSGDDRASSYYNPSESKKQLQNPMEIIMEIEDILQQKLHKGDISQQQFNKLSQQLDVMQQQYQSDEKKDFKTTQHVAALNQLKNEVQSLGEGGAAKA